jgi:beta-glucosidase
MPDKLEFPKNFLWGAATSAHQVEGGQHNDWSEWEQANADRLAREAESIFGDVPGWKERFAAEAADPKTYVSGFAADHWSRYAEDFDILQELHLNAYRFSIEWSRIEPEEGRFDEKAIAHYRAMLESLRARGIAPMITLWHWTNPVWVETVYGGWENPAVGEKFLKFAERIVNEYRDLAQYWAVFNEPNTFVGLGYMKAIRPPQRKSVWRARRAIRNFQLTYKKAYALIHSIQPDAKVVLSHWLALSRPLPDNWLNRRFVPLLDYLRNWQFFKGLEDSCDIIGVQFYRIDYFKFSLFKSTWGPLKLTSLGAWQNDMGWDLEPEAIGQLLRRVFDRFKKPIIITENGLADRDDIHRRMFIEKTVKALHAAISNGVPVKGYFHWSLLDNFEWSEGYWPRFGLVAVDRTTQARTIRPSARMYATIAETNSLETDL